jgi:hypothetical protein
VGIQDADRAYEPLEYRKLLKPLLRDEDDVVFGSRYLYPGTRKILYFWHSWMNRTLTFAYQPDISDMETCYKLFRREISQSIELKENRFGFEPEVVAKVAQMRCLVWECAISYRPRSYEEGKKSAGRMGLGRFTAFSITARIRRRCRFSCSCIYLLVGSARWLISCFSACCSLPGQAWQSLWYLPSWEPRRSTPFCVSRYCVFPEKSLA